MLFLAQLRWQNGLVSVPNCYGTQSLGTIKTCYLFPVGYSYIQSKFYEIKKACVFFSSPLNLHCTNICIKRRKYNSSCSSVHQNGF